MVAINLTGLLTRWAGRIDRRIREHNASRAAGGSIWGLLFELILFGLVILILALLVHRESRR